MKYTIAIFFGFFVSITNGQCKKDTSVQYYDSTYQSYSENYNVTVEFGTGSEISNNYNYSNYESDDLYCLIYGFDKKYEVKLFSNYSSIYKTSCSSISNVFTNGFVKGKDQDGRIWKIKKSSSQNYSNNDNYNNRNSGYNKPKSRINHKKIGEILSSKQAEIDYNRERTVNKMTQILRRIKLLKSKIVKQNSGIKIANQIVKIEQYTKDCTNNVSENFFSSNSETAYVISCLENQMTNLDILESDMKNYSVSDNSKSDKDFEINFTKKKNVDYCRITRVVNKEDKTIIEFEYTSPYQEDGWINISGDTHIYDATNGEKLKLIGVWNTEISPKRKDVPYNKKIRFQLTFERLKNNSKNINIIECERDSCFNFYGVSIN